MIAPPAADGDFVSTVDGRTENLVNLPGPVGVATLTSGLTTALHALGWR